MAPGTFTGRRRKQMNEPQTVGAKYIGRYHARRAIKWLRDRSILAKWSPATNVLSVHVTKHGEEWTRKAMDEALEATLAAR